MASLGRYSLARHCPRFSRQRKYLPSPAKANRRVLPPLPFSLPDLLLRRGPSTRLILPSIRSQSIDSVDTDVLGSTDRVILSLGNFIFHRGLSPFFALVPLKGNSGSVRLKWRTSSFFLLFHDSTRSLRSIVR